MLINAEMYTIAQLAVTLLLVSGRRSAEILNGRSVFAPRADSHFHAQFRGQLKKQGNAAAYTIPLLVPFNVFAQALQILRQKQSAAGISPVKLSEEAVHSKYQKRVASVLDERRITGFLPSLPLSDATCNRHLTPHDLRAIYVALVQKMFCCDYEFPQVAKLVLGHKSVTESLHYQTVRVLASTTRLGMLSPRP
jgi:integrase